VRTAPALAWALAACAFLAPQAYATDITATGSWTLTIGAGDLVAGPGSDLIGTYESAAAQVSFDIINVPGLDGQWRVDVRRSDTAWHADLVLWSRRTGDGAGTGSIAGGTVYQSVGATDAEFFSGGRDRTGIDVQFQLTGVSVSVPPATYTTTVVYTVVDI